MINNSNETKKMRAIICPKYGSPDVFKLEEVAIPEPNENEVLVRNHGT